MELQEYKFQIEAALEHTGGTHVFEDVQTAVEKGELQFWPGLNSVILTEIQDTPQQRILNFFLAGGNSVELEAMLPLVEQWGKSIGATRATLYGRKGWGKSFLTKSQGYKESLVVLEKTL